MAKKKIFLTVAQYANHRGRDQGAVRYAIREGKLSKSIKRDGNGITIDRDLADQEWEPRANWREVGTVQEVVDHAKKIIIKKKKSKKKSKKKTTIQELDDDENDHAEYVPGKEWDPRKPWDTSMLIPINVSRMRREAYETDLAKIKVDKEMSLLVPAKEAEEEWVKIATLMKTKVLGIPSKARQKMPELNDYQYEVIEMIVREVLEELSESNDDTGED